MVTENGTEREAEINVDGYTHGSGKRTDWNLSVPKAAAAVL